MRARSVSIAKLLSLALLLAAPAAYGARFVDLSGSWAERYVNTLSDRGVIGAEPDGKFTPDKPLTRAVLCAWLVKITGVDKQDLKPEIAFSDVKKTDWFYKPVIQAVQNRYVAGYSDGFRPQQGLQKGEVILIVSRTLGTPMPDAGAVTSLLSRYSDAADIPGWAREGVALAAADDLVINHPDEGAVNATRVCSRADGAALLFKLQEFLYKRSIEKGIEKAETAAAAAPAAPAGGGQQQSDDDGDGSGSAGAQSAPAQGADGQPGYSQPAASQPVAGAAPAQSSGPGQAGAPAPGDDQLYGQVDKNAAPGAYLQGNATVVDAGTHFRVSLMNTLNSAVNRPGEEFATMLQEPVYSGGVEVLPVGSKIIGQITNVVSAKSFRFSANGKIDVKFTGVETPDGRRFPLVGSVDVRQLKVASGTNRSQAGTVARKAGKGAVTGAKYGAIGGGVYGATTGSAKKMLKYAGIGAIGGSLVGSAVGAGAGAVQKGVEANVPAGTNIPVQLDEPLQMAGGGGQSVRSLQGGPGGSYSPTGQGYAPQYGAPPQGYATPPGYPTQP